MAKTFYEFFAGGGMARAGLGPEWRCLFANDNDAKKAAAYRANWGGDEFQLADIADLKARDLPGRADLAWASFPCQDLSLAGAGAGLNGARSGTFWDFHRLIFGLVAENRAPLLLVLENVCGALTSHGGKDFAEICSALAHLHYRFGAIVVDAKHFLAQSRPRLFIIAISRGACVAPELVANAPSHPWHSTALQRAQRSLPSHIQQNCVWWRLPLSEAEPKALSELIEQAPTDVRWRSPAETEHLIGLMSVANRRKLETAMRSGRRMVGTIYRRTRVDEEGRRTQRAEVRFDDVAGCLRTPRGGSSRQTIVVVEGECVRSRLLSAREAARLMGLPDSYLLPSNYNEAYHLAGDGVVVPVVAYLSKYLLEPLVRHVALPIAAE